MKYFSTFPALRLLSKLREMLPYLICLLDKKPPQPTNKQPIEGFQRRIGGVKIIVSSKVRLHAHE